MEHHLWTWFVHDSFRLRCFMKRSCKCKRGYTWDQSLFSIVVPHLYPLFMRSFLSDVWRDHANVRDYGAGQKWIHGGHYIGLKETMSKELPGHLSHRKAQYCKVLPCYPYIEITYTILNPTYIWPIFNLLEITYIYLYIYIYSIYIYISIHRYLTVYPLIAATKRSRCAWSSNLLRKEVQAQRRSVRRMDTACLGIRQQIVMKFVVTMEHHRKIFEKP